MDVSDHYSHTNHTEPQIYISFLTAAPLHCQQQVKGAVVLNPFHSTFFFPNHIKLYLLWLFRALTDPLHANECRIVMTHLFHDSSTSQHFLNCNRLLCTTALLWSARIIPPTQTPPCSHYSLTAGVSSTSVTRYEYETQEERIRSTKILGNFCIVNFLVHLLLALHL